MNYTIITGTGSGLGEALARAAIEQEHKVFCISRTLNHSLKEQGAARKTGFWYFEQDLTVHDEIPRLMQMIFSFIDAGQATTVNLINNAGVVDPVGPLGNLDPAEIKNHLDVNLLAPILLSNEFIRLSKNINCRKNIINIGSGAAQNPYYGWTMYCTSKAGLDMLTRTISLEQKEEERPVTVVSVAPGVVDTPMQDRIREVDPRDFPMKPKFEKLHAEGKLIPPREAALKILASLVTSD